jgi:cyanophycinase
MSSLSPLLFLLMAQALLGNSPGPLVVVGGGKTNAQIVEETLRLAGGKAARAAILPQASELPDTGEKSAQMWRDAGAASADVIDLTKPDEARAKLTQASLIWMPGGAQTRLVTALRESGMIETLRECRERGAVIGGTSAGAAVMSALMMSGVADLSAISSKSVELVDGLGLWPEVIVDQHFLKRQRFNRLLSAVLVHPDKIGVGIDESTAVIVTDKGWRVIGASQVLLIQAQSDDPRRHLMHLLQPGDQWPLSP